MRTTLNPWPVRRHRAATAGWGDGWPYLPFLYVEISDGLILSRLRHLVLLDHHKARLLLHPSDALTVHVRAPLHEEDVKVVWPGGQNHAAEEEMHLIVFKNQMDTDRYQIRDDRGTGLMGKLTARRRFRFRMWGCFQLIHWPVLAFFS